MDCWEEILGLPATKRQRHAMYKLQLLDRKLVKFATGVEAGQMIELAVRIYKRVRISDSPASSAQSPSYDVSELHTS